MTDLVLESLQTFMRENAPLDGAPLWINFLGDSPTEYAIIPLGGPVVTTYYISGETIRELPFAIQSVESTADDITRLSNAGFYEQLEQWMDSCTEQGKLPVLPEGKVAREIRATGWGILIEQGESDTGIYQIQCALEYAQE